MAHSAPTHHAPASGRQQHYAVPQPMPWPIMGSGALFLMALGGVFVMNGARAGWIAIAAGMMLLLYMMVRWFGEVIRESEGGKYGRWEDLSFRWGMSWFIFSEVMFFAAFFGALFYARVLALPRLAGESGEEFTSALLWNHFEGTWPSNGPAALSPRANGSFETISALGLPALNTLILLSSGVTVTIAHHALQAGQRGRLKVFLALTFLLGFLFVGLQAHEYHHAYTELGLQLSTGIYGSTFFMLTGFHGFHVTVGAIMLLTIWIRVMKGHFTPKRHFAFEGVAWYWHFVDVVWLLLFILVYWL